MCLLLVTSRKEAKQNSSQDLSITDSGIEQRKYNLQGIQWEKRRKLEGTSFFSHPPSLKSLPEHDFRSLAPLWVHSQNYSSFLLFHRRIVGQDISSLISIPEKEIMTIVVSKDTIWTYNVHVLLFLQNLIPVWITLCLLLVFNNFLLSNWIAGGFSSIKLSCNKDLMYGFVIFAPDRVGSYGSWTATCKVSLCLKLFPLSLICQLENNSIEGLHLRGISFVSDWVASSKILYSVFLTTSDSIAIW